MARPMRSFTEPPGLKNSALAYSGVRIPCVSLLRRINGVQPIVSRTFAYGSVCAGTAIRFRLARVALHAARIARRGAGVARRSGALRPGSGGKRGKHDRWGARGRLGLRDRAAARGAAEFDRLQEGGRDGEPAPAGRGEPQLPRADRKSTRLNSSHDQISYAVFCLKKKKNTAGK